MSEISRVDLFDRPATLGDVIGWILLFQLATLTLIATRIPSTIDKFRMMFTQLGGELPGVTQMILGMPSFVWLVVPLALTGIATWILVKSQNGLLKVAFPACAYVVEVTMVGLAVLGIFYPILQLQSAVRGS